MQRFTAISRVACCVTFALLLASACGGHSSSNGPDDANDAGSSSAGTTGRAGSGSRAGSSGRAGSSSSAGSGSAGDACTGPSTFSADGSSCAAYFRRWTHDSTTGVCTPVVYGGCGATKNNYETLEACQQACAGRAPGYDACKVATDCVLAAPGCCGVCDAPEVSRADFLAYNKLYEGKVQPCGNGNVACGACPNPEGEGTRKYFVPNCVNGECVVEDIRESDVTACTNGEDCRLRQGTGCCEGCGGSDELVSVRGDGSLEKLVCGDLIPPCLACEPAIPSDARPACGLDGHCSVVHILK